MPGWNPVLASWILEWDRLAQHKELIHLPTQEMVTCLCDHFPASDTINSISN